MPQIVEPWLQCNRFSIYCMHQLWKTIKTTSHFQIETQNWKHEIQN